MSISKKNTVEEDFNLNDELFLKLIGQFLIDLRKKAGYSSIRLFVDTIGMSYSQYQRYETGSNITLIVLRRILSFYNLKVEDWLKLDLINSDNDLPGIVESMHKAKMEHVIEQVKIIDSAEVANNLSPKEVSRYIEILEFSIHPRSRNEILDIKLKMDDSTNTFKRVAGKLIEYGWLELTNKANKNSPNQKYITTEAGRKVIILG